METSLHRDLKALYAREGAQTEVKLGAYRIDVVCGKQLVEIQHGSLSAIRDKVRHLLADHRVLIVKPIVAQKRLVKQSARGGRIIGQRMSPKRGRLLDLFDELVYFTRVFPHERLVLEVPLVEIEEWRYPGHGRRRRWRASDHEVEDQKLIAVQEVHRLRTAADLGRLVRGPRPLPDPFHTGQLAAALGVQRWFAQRIAYCLRKTGTVEEVGKQGNARLYQFAKDGKCVQGKYARKRLIQIDRSSDGTGTMNGAIFAGPRCEGGRAQNPI